MNEETVRERAEIAATALEEMIATAAVSRVFHPHSKMAQLRIQFSAMDAAMADLPDGEKDAAVAMVQDALAVAVHTILESASERGGSRDSEMYVTPEQLEGGIGVARSYVGCVTEGMRDRISATPDVTEQELFLAEINSSFQESAQRDPGDPVYANMVATSFTSTAAMVALARAGLALPDLLEEHAYAVREGYTIKGETAQGIRDQIMALVVLGHDHDHTPQPQEV